MKNAIFAVIASAAAVAHADVAPPLGGLVSPFDHAQATIEFIGSNAGYTGELGWISSLEDRAGVFVLNNKQAKGGDRFVLPGLFTAGEPVHFRYEVVRGGLDVFASDTDLDQFRFTALSDTEFLVGIEDIRLPGGDRDYNDVEFRVAFAAVPAPGAVALLGLGLLAVGRRRG